ncbi:hypothetical protein C7W93_13220 [Glaciimonas sp. PCH181]|nr:hypothetical protein C7W93_13220 [Glaciimonas sp. PCH181]
MGVAIYEPKRRRTNRVIDARTEGLLLSSQEISISWRDGAAGSSTGITQIHVRQAVAYVKVGLTPDGGATAFLAEFVSRQILTELCLTGDRITGERLHAMGAVNRLTDHGGAVAEAVVLAARLGAGPARASARIKSLCRHAYGTNLEVQYMVESQGDPEAAEGITTFISKRSPDFVTLRGKQDRD